MRKVLASLLITALAAVCADDSKWSIPDQEKFLKTARVVEISDAGKGYTKSQKAMLDDGKRKHMAHLQTVDRYKAEFHGTDGSFEKDFKDSWKFNVAGWRLAKMIGLSAMVPPSVPRVVEGKPGSLTWWIDGIKMDEQYRRDNKIEPPDKDRWRRQMATIRVFDQLIHNMDRNQENILIAEDWHVWMIDHTRAFRKAATLRNAKAITECDPALLKAIKRLNERDLTREIGEFVTPEEIAGLLARRDLIVEILEKSGTNPAVSRRAPNPSRSSVTRSASGNAP
ncbi:MAG: hypothetical protein IT168_23700 [Bryobacterales bacterium]|nr:hypothetical protein [Bryobacterales bacterium]